MGKRWVLAIVILVVSLVVFTQTATAQRIRGDLDTIIITPKRTQFGAIYGADAHDKASGTLLATAKQVAVEGNLLVVEETQYSSAGAVVYKGRLFFSPARDLVKVEKIEGNRKWEIFRTWISDRP